MSTAQGECRIVGKVHGALNTIVTFYDDPEAWEFKQFTSDMQLNQFLTEHNLLLVENKDGAH